MKKEEFLNKIYSNLKIGMTIRKPRKKSKILDITESGNIYYLIGDNNKKAVTKGQLALVYEGLEHGGLTTKEMGQICGPSNPCNVTTIKWILEHIDLARRRQDGIWYKTWVPK